ncbi:MAG: hypothetical protein II719_06040 [Clostridia bacterium]|nr:hypothetical protein [Clostridia bacterium]
MTYEESIAVSAEIGRTIAQQSPCIRYTEEDLKNAEKAYSKEELEELKTLGLMPGEFETFYVLREFFSEMDLGSTTDGGYIAQLFRNGRHLDEKIFLANPFLSAITVPDRSIGRFRLAHSSYERGEIFHYDMPDFEGRFVVPKLGFFSVPVSFPALYEGPIPWVSVCPSEIHSMEKAVRAAWGDTLVLGLGLGYYAFRISQSETVRSVTVVEREQEVIDLFTEYLLPQFPMKEKVRILCGDAVSYTQSLRDGVYDFCFADIWEGAVDGAGPYCKIRNEAKRMVHTEFSYWIEPQIRAYLGELP